VDGSGTLYVTGALGPNSTSYLPYYWAKAVSTAAIAIALPVSNSYGWTNGVIWDGATNIYIAGAEGTSSAAESPYYWKVGATTSENALSMGTNTYGFARGVGVYSSGSTVCIAGGSGTSSSAMTPQVWIAGADSPLTMSPGDTWAYAATVSFAGTNIYIGGIEGISSSSATPAYWFNGTANKLPLGGNSYFWNYRTAVDTSGNLYTAGGVGTSSSTPVPCYWVNGSLYTLPMG